MGRSALVFLFFLVSPALLHANPAQQTYTSADVTRALRDAEMFQREGQYEKSLERHIWYHKNALKYDPAQSGVRLSFALSDWVDLGKKYPKAMHALRSIRNEDVAAFRQHPSDSEMYQEAMSINLEMDDLKSAKSLFYLGRRHGMDGDSLSLSLDQILATRDYKWASDIIGNPSARLNLILDDRNMSRPATSGHPDLAQDLDKMYGQEVANLLRAVAKVKGEQAARRLQKKALKSFNSPIIRDALQ